MKRIALALLPLAPRCLREWHARRARERIATLLEYRDIFLRRKKAQ